MSERYGEESYSNLSIRCPCGLWISVKNVSADQATYLATVYFNTHRCAVAQSPAVPQPRKESE